MSLCNTWSLSLKLIASKLHDSSDLFLTFTLYVFTKNGTLVANFANFTKSSLRPLDWNTNCKWSGLWYFVWRFTLMLISDSYIRSKVLERVFICIHISANSLQLSSFEGIKALMSLLIPALQARLSSSKNIETRKLFHHFSDFST